MRDFACWTVFLSTQKQPRVHKGLKAVNRKHDAGITGQHDTGKKCFQGLRAELNAFLERTFDLSSIDYLSREATGVVPETKKTRN
jgi:hypothetical protein